MRLAKGEAGVRWTTWYVLDKLGAWLLAQHAKAMVYLARARNHVLLWRVLRSAKLANHTYPWIPFAREHRAVVSSAHLVPHSIVPVVSSPHSHAPLSTTRSNSSPNVRSSTFISTQVISGRAVFRAFICSITTAEYWRQRGETALTSMLTMFFHPASYMTSPSLLFPQPSMRIRASLPPASAVNSSKMGSRKSALRNQSKCFSGSFVYRCSLPSAGCLSPHAPVLVSAVALVGRWKILLNVPSWHGVVVRQMSTFDLGLRD